MARDAARAVGAVRRLGRRGRGGDGADAVWVGVSHGDVIKSMLADALGMHLDLFQRIQVDPALDLGDPLHRGAALRAALPTPTVAICTSLRPADAGTAAATPSRVATPPSAAAPG